MSETPSLARRRYVGRFAPSPTGPLHAGSLVAALASHLDARAHHGQWLLRIEDLDPPREVAGATEAIIATLHSHGFVTDRPVIVQSTRQSHYEDALAKLNQQGDVYRCICSRKDIGQTIANARHRPDTEIAERPYPRTCFRTPPPCDSECAWRLHVGNVVVTWQERHHADLHPEALAETSGDFIVKRRDGLWSYQLAVVVDDGLNGVTDVVRGDDLLSNTARQCLLQEKLGLARPHYVHVPIVRNAAGEKLSKQTNAPAIAQHPAPGEAVRQLNAALRHLGLQSVPVKTLNEFWPAAIVQWRNRILARRRCAQL